MRNSGGIHFPVFIITIIDVIILILVCKNYVQVTRLMTLLLYVGVLILSIVIFFMDCS